MTTQTAPITAEQLLGMGDIGRCELVRGEIVKMAPGSAEHGDISLDVGYHIKAFLKVNRLGKAYGAETGFIIARNPDTVRAPDVAFVRSSRLTARPSTGYFPGPPDLAVEVVSPGDRTKAVLEKVQEWLTAGTISVWVIHPRRRTVQIYQAGQEVIALADGDDLQDDRTLPGFSLKLTELFDSQT